MSSEHHLINHGEYIHPQQGVPINNVEYFTKVSIWQGVIESKKVQIILYIYWNQLAMCAIEGSRVRMWC